MNIQEQHAEIMRILEQIAEQYATDANGEFDRPAYDAFKAGYLAGLGAKIHVTANNFVTIKPSDGQ